MDSNSDRWEESQPSCHRRHHRGPSSRKTCFQCKIMSGKKSKKSFCEFFSAYRRSVSLYSSIRPTLRNALMIEKQLSRFFSSLFFFFCENSIESEKRVFFQYFLFLVRRIIRQSLLKIVEKITWKLSYRDFHLNVRRLKKFRKYFSLPCPILWSRQYS